MTRQAENAVDAGEGGLEARGLRQRLAANPEDLDARVLLARLYWKRGLPDLALEHYRLAAMQFPDAPVVELELAKTLRGMNQNGEALKTIDAFLKKHPGGSWELLSLEGILEDERGQAVKAEAAHRAALALDPQRSALHNNLGFNLLAQKRVPEAAEEFRRAIELDPHSEIAHNNLASALAAQSQEPQRVLTELQRAANEAVAHNNLAVVWMEQGRYAEARGELEAALRLRPDLPQAIANMRLVAAADGKPVTLPPVPPPVNFWRRFTSAFGKLNGAPSKESSAQPGTPSTGGISAGAPSVR